MPIVISRNQKADNGHEPFISSTWADSCFPKSIDVRRGREIEFLAVRDARTPFSSSAILRRAALWRFSGRLEEKIAKEVAGIRGRLNHDRKE